MGIKVPYYSKWLKELRATNPVLGQIVRQSVDQPLHVLMAWGSCWAIGWPLVALGVSVAVSVTVAGILTAAWMAIREYRQWPSPFWWDPPMDWTFQAGGLALGVWSILAILR